MSTAAPETNTGVVIAGAGPVGLMLACELRRAGVPVIIVERLASPMTESRASQLTTVTAEIFHERGFDPLLAEAVLEPRAHFAGVSFDLSRLPSDYAGNWKVPQYRTERVLHLRAAELGATLLRAHEVTGIAASEDHVVCEIRSPAEDARIRARYLVGCDGAASTVRRLCGFTSRVTTATKELLRADVTGIEIPDRRFERLEGGFAAAACRDGVTRVTVHAFGRPVTERRAPPRFAEVARLWEQVTGEDIGAGNAIWVDAFDNSTGLVDSYRLGRVLLAGDAAHWHPPIGGQALNLGLQDAVNLGWKLAGLVNGWASSRLLDSYHGERHPVAARVLDYVAAQEMLLFGGDEVGPLHAVLAELIGLDPVRSYLARVVTGFDDRYGVAGSPLTGRRLENAKLRDEYGSVITPGLLTGTEPVIVRLSPRSNEKAETVAFPCGFKIQTIYAIPERADFFAGVHTILLRPDGYVAWAGDDDAELRLAIEQWFGLATDGGKKADGAL